jgi:hypothetical protein
MASVGATFLFCSNLFLNVKCHVLSSFSLRDMHLLKISVVSTCEITRDVMFHNLPLYIVKQKSLLLVPRNIALRGSQVTRFTNPDVRGREKFQKLTSGES